MPMDQGDITMTQNRQVLLVSRPQGPVTEQNFRIVDAPLRAPADGEVLVRNEWLSLDPYMRGRMSDAKSYVPPATLDEPMTGQTVGEVLESRDARFKPGDKVLTPLGWQSHGVARGDDLVTIDVRRAPRSTVSHMTARQETSDGKRAANSLTPNAKYVEAVSHVDSGGLLQCGTPYLNCGHNQSPVSIILRAISP